MPNWCQNRLTLRAKPEKLAILVDWLKQEKDDAGLFSLFLPTPKELDETVSGFVGDGPEGEAYRAKQQANKDKYGHTDWYGWRVENWGCKWDVDRTNVTGESVDVTETETSVSLCFDTPWSPPCALYSFLAHTLGINVEAYYIEFGNEFAGTCTYEFDPETETAEGGEVSISFFAETDDDDEDPEDATYRYVSDDQDTLNEVLDAMGLENGEPSYF